MKLRKKHADMPVYFYFLLKEVFLQLKIILLAQKLCYTTPSVLKKANRIAFCMQALNIEATFLKCLFEAFCYAGLSGHLLCLATELRVCQGHSRPFSHKVVDLGAPA